MIKYQQLKMPPGYTMGMIKEKISKQLHIPQEEIRDLHILKESIDARKKPDVFYLLSVAFSGNRERELLGKYSKKAPITPYEAKSVSFPVVDSKKVKDRPVIVGAGPAGLFCAYYLARAGLCPIVLERGRCVEERIKDVENFWEKGILDPDSNVQFGEGGAGTFSDGKLNTLNKDTFGYQKEILGLFVKMGADDSILYRQRPHLGTDKLIHIVKNLREEIKKMGGEVRFEAKVTDFLIREDGKRRMAEGVIINGEETLLSPWIILAPGHSARDTFLRLEQLKFPMEAKAFAVGYRVQHSQKSIDISQYGEENLGKFPPAPYKLTAGSNSGRGIYSFCMCPGGYVVNSSSEKGMLCINGMSYSDRSGDNANSAIIISVTPEDFEDRGPLSGMYFQRELEKRAYEKAEGKIPLQRLEDYKENKTSTRAGAVVPCLKGQYGFANLRGILPEPLEEAFLEGMEQFGRKIKGFDHPDTLLAGIEARTSSPVRIIRSERCESDGIAGIFPCGEGAGYAGGITSAAMDGLRVALAVMKNLEEI